MKIAFFGSSLVSSYWNGAATYFRGLLFALSELGYEISFFEPDAYERQQHRDCDAPSWARSIVYEATESGLAAALAQTGDADIVVKASGVGVFDDELMRAVPRCARQRAVKIFWDVDAPATLAAAASDAPGFRNMLAPYDLILTYGGGAPVVQSYEALSSVRCVPIYNGLDPRSHFLVAADPRFASDLTFLGNRLPDREERVTEFFFAPADALPERRFILGGAGWASRPMPANVWYHGHVSTQDHNKLNCSALAVLNVSRDSMAANGFSPATRVFEAAGAGACIITDHWTGIEEFFAPEREILIARDGLDVRDILAGLTNECAREIGEAARQRALRDHDYAIRARQLDQVLRAQIETMRVEA